MNDPVLEKMIAEYLSPGLPESIFCWQGGEPTLAGIDFFERVVAFQKKHGHPGQVIGNALQTNGVLIDDAWGEFLSEYNFLVGLSIDGPPEVHNKYRIDKGGRKTFDKAMRAVEILRKYDIQYNILSTVHAGSRGKGRQIYRWMKSNGFKHLQFIPVLERDENGKGWADYSIDKHSYGEFLCDVFDEWYDSGVSDVSVRMFDDIISIYLTGSCRTCNYQKSCNSYLLIEKNGDVYPCDFYVRLEWKLGNIMNSDFKSLFLNEKHREFSNGKAKNRNLCLDCKWYMMCAGDCMRLRASIDDRSYFCESYKKFFEHSNSRFVEICEKIKRQNEAGVNRISHDKYKGIGRNELCPCGSGKKYKKCCLNKIER